MRHIVIGGGILGLAVARELTETRPADTVVVVEKETSWAAHQTGRNSGVIHSGLYYPPGSAKALMCRDGAARMVAFARDEGIPYAVRGKLVVATSADELPRLRALAERGRANGLAVREVLAGEAREFEPHVNAVAALHIPETGIIDYAAVCRVLATRLTLSGVTLRLGAHVVGAVARGAGIGIRLASGEEIGGDRVVVCAGLQSDLVARALGHRPSVRIVPFRGEYFALREEARPLVRGLIYPVPDPALPFLGVHLTRGIDGGVHAGPNAVLALAREGYRWSAIAPRDLATTLAYAGTWRLARRYWRAGGTEFARSLSRRRFGDSLRRLLPAIRDEDLLPSAAGVRAQALRRDGALVDDFLIERAGPCVFVLNAPSPAATAAFAIARHVVAVLGPQ
ncbi:MAG: L-2-hydroxyglutarate oxidase [Dermatophilaceae bacterium]